MADLLDELSARCDVVLVDTPPLLPVTDAAVFASRCDGALLIVRHGRTTRNQVRAARSALSTVSARLLGAVLTMTSKARSRRPSDGPFGHPAWAYPPINGTRRSTDNAVAMRPTEPTGSDG